MDSGPLQSTYNKLELLRQMVLSREGDRREGVLLRQSKGWFHVGAQGHEAIAVLGELIRKEDYLFGYYRERPLILARGISNRKLAQAYFGKRESSSGGRQMPGHHSNRDLNIWSVPTPTGSVLLPACGAAWAMQLLGKDTITIGTIGDAACRQGEFFEALCFAAQLQLPIVFLVEDNRYGISTNTEKMNPFRMNMIGEGIDVVHVDARYPDRIYDVAAPAIDKARRGEGPTVLLCDVDRICDHTSSDDQRIYRSAEEIAEMHQRDPIDLVAAELIETGELTPAGWNTMKAEVVAEVDADYLAAQEDEDPTAEELTDHLYGPVTECGPVPLAGGRNWRIIDAVNAVFRHALDNDDRYVFFGQDIEDPKGGVFGLTKGLSTAHPDRVFNSPLAEATIVGAACGMACYGLRPVFEIQFVDFVSPAWNQLTQNVATMRWRTCSDWPCPIVFYMPYGAYLPGGSIWHSQSNEALFAHIPGLRVVVPSTPEDAAALMWTALHAEDPTIFLIPKHRFRKQFEVSEPTIEPVPFGKGIVRREGDDVTIVTWGNCIELAYEASDQLRDEMSVEIIDLRSLVPWDRALVRNSLEKTGRLVVIQEDAESCSFGQKILADMVSNPDSWGTFMSPPQLVSRPDVHVGFNPIYEYAALPSTAQVIESLRLTMED